MFDCRLDALTTTTVALLLLLMGRGLKRHFIFLQRVCIPTPVIGGSVMVLFLLALRQTGIATVSFDTAIQWPLMIAFFTIIGMSGSFTLLRVGGIALFVYLAICWCVAIIQNSLGISIAYLLGIDPILGIMAGGVSLSGGHGTAAAFGPIIESLGYTGATTIALTSATFGLVAGALLGGPVTHALIRYHHIAMPVADHTQEANQPACAWQVDQKNRLKPFDTEHFISTLGLILVLMVGGIQLVAFLKQQWGFSLPAFTGAMVVALLFRNLNDKFAFFVLNQRVLDIIGDISLGIFLIMAMMTLKIWELVDLALPLLTILTLQIIVISAICVFVVFPLLGRNYDAAVMCSGLMGHGLGATPNALANMNAVSERYGVRSHKAFLIVPLCGSVLMDLFAVPFHAWMIHLLRGS